MGCELCKLEGKDVWVVYDNTSGEVIKFHDFKTLLKAIKILGRDVKECFILEDLIYEFENIICFDWDDDENQIGNEINKIREYWK